MLYKKTKYDFISVGSDGEVYSTWKGLTKKKCSIRKGLKSFRIRVNGSKRTVNVAKLVADLFIPNTNNYRFVLTKDGNETNTSPDNLYWSKKNRMDYKAFAKKKKGMVYKSYVGRDVGCYTVIEDNTKECILECSNCNDSVIVSRDKIKKKHFIGVCDKVKYKLDIESLDPSAAYKNWKVLEEVETESLPMGSKLLKLKSLFSDEEIIVSYNSYINNTQPVYCKSMSNKRKILYRKLYNMKQRCYNEKNKSYKTYGGRGITICDEWLTNFESFMEWSLNNNYEIGLEIDRIDGNKGYSPDNCQYISKTENVRKQVTKLFTDEQVKYIKYNDWGKLTDSEIAVELGFGKEKEKYRQCIGNIRKGILYKHI